MMNNRQKLAYMVLGATVLAVGIAMGRLITPDIEAQRNGVFDEITCRKVKVVDEMGNVRIILYSTIESPGGDASTIFLQNKEGHALIGLYARDSISSVDIKNGLGKPGIQMRVSDHVNSLEVEDTANKEAKISFGSAGRGATGIITDKSGNVIWGVP